MSKHLALVDPVTGETETGDLEELLVWAFEEDPALLARVLQALHKARRPPSQPGVVQLLHALRGNFSHSTEEWWGEYRARLLRAVAAEAGPEVAALLPDPVVFGESTRRGRLPLTVADAPEEGQREAIERAAQLLEHPTPQAVGAALALLRAAAEGREPAVRDEGEPAGLAAVKR